MARELFYGAGLSVIDAKGRVAIPTDLRAQLLANGGQEARIALNLHVTGEFLVAFEKAHIPQLQVKSDQDYEDRDRTNPVLTRDYFDELYFGGLETQPFDASGRFILSSQMREMGRLEDVAYFYGAGAMIRIWNPRLGLESPLVGAAEKKRMQAIMRERGLL